MARWVGVGRGRESNPRPRDRKSGTVPLGHRGTAWLPSSSGADHQAKADSGVQQTAEELLGVCAISHRHGESIARSTPSISHLTVGSGRIGSRACISELVFFHCMQTRNNNKELGQKFQQDTTINAVICRSSNNTAVLWNNTIFQ